MLKVSSMFHYPLYLGIYCSSLWSRESLTLRKHYTFYFSQPLLKNLTIQTVSYTIAPTFKQPLDEAVDVDLAVGHRDGRTSDFEFSVCLVSGKVSRSIGGCTLRVWDGGCSRPLFPVTASPLLLTSRLGKGRGRN